MSLTLSGLKSFLSVAHNEDDTKLTLLLSAAEDELLRFLDCSELPPTAASVDLALCFLVRASYDAPDAEEANRWREVARSTAHSYRVGLGA